MALLSKPVLGTSASIAVALGMLGYCSGSRFSPQTLCGKISSLFVSLAQKQKSDQDSDKKHVKLSFVKKLFYILKTILPGLLCRESYQMSMLMVALVARTFMSLFVAWNMGRSVEYICNRSWAKSFKSVGIFGLVTTVASVINAYLKYVTSELSISLRERFLTRIHDEYMKRNNYYRCTKLGERKVQFADQLICDDIARWSESFSEVYSSIFKPVVDFFLFSWQLYDMSGIQGPLGMYLWFFVAAGITNLSLPPYGKLASREQQLEGEFRDAHCRLINNSEMVAFMGGEIPERKLLDDSFLSIKQHRNMSNRAKLSCDVVMGYVNKYFASCVGFVVMMRPIYYGEFGLDDADAGAIAKYYVAIRHIMENLSNAVLALFEVQKMLGRLAGLTNRVYELLYKVSNSEMVFEDLKQLCPRPPENNLPETSLSDSFNFENVSIYRPDGALLAKHLNFKIEHGCKVIITGPNGCGKSSLFRILRGLWPLIEGKIEQPRDEDIYFLSQVNFVPKGNLRHLITYPHTDQNVIHSDEFLQECLNKAHLGGFEVQGIRPSMDTVLDWDVALSPGQKQRMGFARLFYHSPRFAVLDECTNGISPDVEEDLYKQCELSGISVFSISHKVELKRLHDYELHYFHDSEGTYKLIDLKANSN